MLGFSSLHVNSRLVSLDPPLNTTNVSCGPQPLQKTCARLTSKLKQAVLNLRRSLECDGGGEGGGKHPVRSFFTFFGCQSYEIWRLILAKFELYHVYTSSMKHFQLSPFFDRCQFCHFGLDWRHRLPAAPQRTTLLVRTRWNKLLADKAETWPRAFIALEELRDILKLIRKVFFPWW